MVALLAILPATVSAQSRFIRTPAESMAATGDRIPPSWYGYPINDLPSQLLWRRRLHRYYGYGRGYGFAGFPSPYARTVPDSRSFGPLYTSYPENGEVYVRSPARRGRPMAPLAPIPCGAHQHRSCRPTPPSGSKAKSLPETGPTRTFVSAAPGSRQDLSLYELRALLDRQRTSQRRNRYIINVQADARVTVKFPLGIPRKPSCVDRQLIRL